MNQKLLPMQGTISKDNNTLFLVAGDKVVPYEEIMKGITLLKDAGVKSVGLMTEGK